MTTLPPDRLRQGLSAIDDEQPRHVRVEPALDEIVDERLHGCGVLGRTFDKTERMFGAHGVDPNRRHKDQIVIQMNAVDLDHQPRLPRRPAGDGG